MKKRIKNQLKILFKAACVMFLGLLLFKWIPMQMFGENILFDASAHLTIAIFVLYVIWFFVDQNKKLHAPFFLLSAVALLVIAFQRIIDNAHNDIGLLAGLVISVVAILYSQYDEAKKQLEF